MKQELHSAIVPQRRAASAWQQWLRFPQKLALRRTVFQVHLWAGIGLGIYILLISVTGSVLVYRNELFRAAWSGSAINIEFVQFLMDLHDNLLGGDVGRTVNGIGAILTLLLALTGLFIWWPGIRRWRRSLSLRRGIGWRRFVWDLHSAIGIWSFALIFMFALSGVYLAFPDAFHSLADPTQPDLVDDILYWLAFLHFGRIDGIGIPCDGPGVCDQTIKAIWAIFGLAPAAMFVTGSIMWWNRVLRRWRRHGVAAANRCNPSR
jgi:uncharacterized iron-regulated membrane protein